MTEAAKSLASMEGLDTTPVDRALAVHIEAAEARAWVDLYAAAPVDWAAAAGLGTRETAGGVTVLSWAATGRRYFSRAIGLGVATPARERVLDEIIEGWERDGISMFLLQSLPHCLPAAYETWLRDRGLEPFDRQDRVIRSEHPPLPAARRWRGREMKVERIQRETADEWAAFLQRVYRLDTGSWLQRLIGRRGWHVYAAREAGEIVAARSMFIDSEAFAWWGMDGPVPGVTTDDFEPDALLCEHMLADGLKLGARWFLADIEAPSEQMDTPAYAYFQRLGFRRPYVRTHWARI